MSLKGAGNTEENGQRQMTQETMILFCCLNVDLRVSAVQELRCLYCSRVS